MKTPIPPAESGIVALAQSLGYTVTKGNARPETMVQVILRTGTTRYKLTHYMKQLAKAGKPVPCERTRGGRILSLTSTPELEAMLSGLVKGVE